MHTQVLFMQGGASAQFAAVPLNLTQPGQKVLYFLLQLGTDTSLSTPC